MHRIIYIPGLGDSTISGQQKLLSIWRLWGVKTTLVQMNWADKKPFAPKLEKVLLAIDDATAHGDTVSLMAASAGGSMAIAAYAARKSNIHKVVLICGEVKADAHISPHFTIENPAFGTSMHYLAENLAQLDTNARARIRSYHPIADNVVPVRDTNIEGADSKCMPVMGHAIGIGYGLSVASFGIARWVKKQN